MSTRSYEVTRPQPTTINALLAALVDELAEGGVPSPLAQPLTLGLVWADLCRLAGEDVPLAVLRLIEGDADDLPPAA